MPCRAFVATLPASDYGFVLFVPSQRMEDFVHAIIQCLKHLGGVPKMLAPDNLKAAVVKADRYEPSLNWGMEAMDEISNALKSLKMLGMAHYWATIQETRQTESLSRTACNCLCRASWTTVCKAVTHGW